jgi:hypothetical protein
VLLFYLSSTSTWCICVAKQLNDNNAISSVCQQRSSLPCENSYR